jgi:hypothetical protein
MKYEEKYWYHLPSSSRDEAITSPHEKLSAPRKLTQLDEI